MLVIPALSWWRQEDPWGSLVRSHRLFQEPETLS